MDARSARSPVTWWTLLAALVVVLRLLSPGIIQGADAVLNFQLANYSWTHPELFLDARGGPLFTLLASPFAQLGIWGMALFTALCFVATAWAADGWMRRAGIVAQWAYAPVLLLIPIYGIMVLAGMSEVLFGLFTVLVVRFLLDERYVLAMIVLSFTPFVRPEYITFVPFVLGWMIWKRRWFALPFVLVGHLVYGIIGGIATGDVLWALHDGSASWQAVGEQAHYVDPVQTFLSAPFIAIAVIAAIVGCWLWSSQRGERGMLGLLFVTAFLPSVAMIWMHSIGWQEEGQAPSGLLRVMTMFVPLLVLSTVWPIIRSMSIAFRTTVGRWVALVVVGGLYLEWVVSAFLVVRPLPQEQDPYDAHVKAIAEHVGRIRDGFDRVVYFNPLLAYYGGFDPFDGSAMYGSMEFDRTGEEPGFMPNDLVVREARSGPYDAGVSLDSLFQRADLELIEMVVPAEQWNLNGSSSQNYYLFKYGDGRSRMIRHVLLDAAHGLHGEMDHRFDTVQCDGADPGWCFKAVEFPFEIVEPPLDTAGLFYADITVSGIMHRDAQEGSLEVVLTDEREDVKVHYWADELRHGPFSITYRTPPRPANVKTKLYLWNRTSGAFRIEDLRVVVERRVRAR